MTVDMLDTGVILVSMGDTEMRAYTLDFSERADSERVKSGLIELLYRIGEICGVDYSGKSCLVEALPAKSGCLLVISVRPVRRRRVYRIKRPITRDVCIFSSADPLLDYLQRCSGRIAGYTDYRYNGEYALIPEVYSASALAELSEYGRLLSVSPIAAARIEEFGEAVLQRRHRRLPSSAAI